MTVVGGAVVGRWLGRLLGGGLGRVGRWEQPGRACGWPAMEGIAGRPDRVARQWFWMSCLAA